MIVRDLLLGGGGVAVDAVRAEGHGRWAHDITLERLTIVNHGASQQNSGISTKCAAWNWIVRANTIASAGTGMYFGDSDGSDPFFHSLIEDNRIIDPLGYGIQIKHQLQRPDADPSAATIGATVLRRNVIVKRRVASAAELARPSLLVGHMPLEGAGARDRFLIYRNLIVDNPSESLFQGEGNFALYNNLFVNRMGDGVRIRPHNDRPREVSDFYNTVVAAGLGIGFTGGAPGYARTFERNLVYGRPPIGGEILGDNYAGDYELARQAFVRFGRDPGQLDLTPRVEATASRELLGTELRALPGAEADFLGRKRGSEVFGACLPADPRVEAPCL